MQQISFEKYCDMLTGLQFRSRREEGTFWIWTGYRNGMRVELWQGLSVEDCWLRRLN